MNKNSPQEKSTMSHWGAFNATVLDGKIVSVAPFPEDPFPSRIPELLPKAVTHPTRVKTPAIRKEWLKTRGHQAQSLRGDDSFVEIPWDEALDIATTAIDETRNQEGNEAIFGGSYGWASAGRFHHAGTQVHRFLNSIGGYVSSRGTYSAGTAETLIPHVLGRPFFDLTFNAQNSWETIARHTETLVMFGGINQKNSQVSLGGITRHQTRDWLQKFSDSGMNLINISPQRSDTTPNARWLSIIPGTDTAMMLGIAHFLETQDLVDRDFLARCTEGYEVFQKYLLGDPDGQAKDCRWAAEICGIEEATICDLAKLMASTRCLTTVAWSLQRAEFGEQPFWMATVLAAMLGQIGLPGGGIGYGYGAIAGVGNAYKNLKSLALSEGVNSVTEFIPVARIADMLMHGGEEYEFNGIKRTYPNIELVYWCGGNPFHHHQDLNRLRLAWQKPRTIIVHEPWWTSTARHADIVFPATTPYEREDISYALGDSFVFHMPQLIDPVGNARDDYEIFSALAKRLDVEEKFTEGRDSEQWLEHIYSNFCEANEGLVPDAPTLSELREKNWVELSLAKNERDQTPFLDFREDPSTNPLRTPSGRIEIFSSTIEEFGYDDCTGHPTWHEPSEWLGADASAEFPLHLVSPQPPDKLHSQMECVIADIEGARPAPLTIHPIDASDRSLNDGDIACAFNGRGKTLVKVLISDSIRKGVVSLCTGAWFCLDEDGVDQQGNPNTLTRDKGTSRLGQGSTAHTALVQVKALE